MGQEAGYAGLYNRYGKGIFNSISRIVRHSAEAEDLLQESFHIIFSELPKLESPERFAGCAKRIAINRSISYLRKAKIHFSDIIDIELPTAEEYDAQEDQIFEGRVEEVKKCISGLSQGYKTIVSLYLFEDMSQQEIAQALGISHNTVRTQYHRAKKKILQQLNEQSYYG